MSDADRDLVAALRSELAAIDPARPCDRRALAAGLGGLGPGRGATARLAIRLGIGVPPSRGADEAGAAVGEGFEWSGARDHCRWAYLRGRFLAHGSLSISGGRTHLEFVVPTTEAAALAGHLADLDMAASWRIRRGRGVVTWKSTETVGLFLRRAGAGAALLELEARQVSRAVRGDLNRVINAESANLTRAVMAAARQLAAIGELEADGRLAREPHVVRAVAEARKETPEATLSDLADRLGLHRSAAQRALERLERLVEYGAAGASGGTSRRRRRSGDGAPDGPRRRTGRTADAIGPALS